VLFSGSDGVVIHVLVTYPLNLPPSGRVFR